MRIFWLIMTAIVLACPFAAQAEIFPGRAAGSIGGRSFDFELDCKSWQDEERMVFAAGDGRSGTDTNGDGLALSFHYFAPMNMTSAQLTLEGQVHNMDSGLVRPAGAPVWEVGDDSARWQGEVPTPEGMAMADVTIDCAPREAAERGLTGRVFGTFGDLAIDKPLGCESWGSDAIEIATERASLPRLQASYFRAMGDGILTVTTEERKFEMVAIRMIKTEFEVTPDALRFAHDIRYRQTGQTIAVDLTFDCTVR